MKSIISLCLLFVTLFFNIHAQADEKIKNKVKLYLKWKHQFQFAGYYAALEKGYYKEAGLDVEIIERKLKWKVTEKVSDKIGSYGISDSSIVLSYLNGLPVTILSSIFQHSPLVLATREKDHLLSPIELKGKKVMYQKNYDDAVFKIMFENAGIDEKDIIHIPHTMNNNDLISGKVDAISIYSTNQPYYFKKKNFKVHLIDPKNYGVDLYGDILFTSQAEVDENPARVEAMKEASIRGWYYALNNIEEVARLIKKKYNAKADLELIIFEANATRRIIQPDLVPIGFTSTGRLQRIAEYYKSFNDTTKSEFKNILLDEYLKSNKLFSPLFMKIIIGLLIFIGIVFKISLYFNRKLKKEVEKKTLKINKIQDQRDLFFSTMTHELRTPINGIIGATYFLNEAKSEEEKTELIDAITNSGNTLLHIVNDILDFSKLQQKEMTLNLQTYKLERVMDEALLIHRTIAENKSLSFIYNPKFDSELCIRTDRIKLSQIINNIVGNAIKFTDQGKVEITCEQELIADKAKITFIISDTGPGIKDEEKDNLFMPFKQANNKVSSQYGGTGLGLNISKKIIELMDGSIEFYNNPTKGMTFKVQLECEIIRNHHIDTTQKIEIFPDYNYLRILIVDDSQLNLILLKKYFNKFNINPDSAENGSVALKKIAEKDYDMIFMDNQMPIMNGIEATKAIRKLQDQQKANTYIVGQSANWISGLDPECKKLGMNATIAKPTRINDLRDILIQYIEEVYSKK